MTKEDDLGEGWKAFADGEPQKTDITNPKVSIRPNGDLCFLKAAVDRYQLNTFDYVKYYWDKDLRQVGVQFTTEPDEYTVKVGYNSNDEFTAPFHKFMTQHNLNIESTERYEIAKFDQEENFLVIDLMSSGSGNGFEKHTNRRKNKK